MIRLASIFAAVALLGFMIIGSVTSARAETVIESATVVNEYPKQLTFKLTARADADITGVTLNYSIAGRGTSALGKPADLTPARNLSTEVVLPVNSASSYIPVGSDFTYFWEITTADGATFSGPEARFFYLPPGQEWLNVSNEFMTVYYHGDKTTLANAYLKAGAETYQKIGKDLFGVTLTQLPVKVILFDDERESDPARPGTGGRFDATVTTCGTKVTNDILLLIPLACGSSDRTDTLRHELGHILNETAGDGPLGKLPSWLDEGTAVYAQSSPGEYAPAFSQGVRQNRLIAFNQMGNPTADASLVGVFYGQSYMMVKYLIDRDGPAKYREYFSTIQKGARFDAALQTVYGMSLAQFETEFRAAVNAQPARPAATTGPTTRPQQANPTAVPTRASGAAAQSGSQDDDGFSKGTIAIIGVAVLFGLLAVFAFLISTLMANTRTAAAANADGVANAPGPAEPPSDAWRPAPPPQDDWRPPSA